MHDCNLEDKMNDFPKPDDEFSSSTEMQTLSFEQENARRKIEVEQNLGLGLVGGLGGMLIGAVIWALITYLTDYQLGIAAIGVGYLAGMGVQRLGKGLSQPFGMVGAITAGIGVILGNYLTILLLAMRELGLSVAEVIQVGTDFPLVLEIMIDFFSPIDLLFYGLAVYYGYRTSFRKLTEEELKTLQGVQPEI